jgi:hypothetical protein
MRSAPDGNPYNNWSFPDNVNPYTGEIAKGDPETYLRNYYRSDPGAARETGAAAGANVTSVAALPPSRRQRESDTSGTDRQLMSGAVLPNFVAQEDLQRSQYYCHQIYAAGSALREDCEINQYRTLARVVLPDYSTLSQQEVSRSAGYCERIYSDNRAAFYHCVNRQILGLQRGRATFFGVEPIEAARAEGYCDDVYEDNRAAAADCTRAQARGLAGGAPDTAGLPAGDWNASSGYCERIYGENRAAVATCKRDQAKGLQGSPHIVDLPADEWNAASGYCERMYEDNRSAVNRCKNDQALGLLGSAPESQGLPAGEWDTASHYCERLYEDNRAAVLNCKRDQARRMHRHLGANVSEAVPAEEWAPGGAVLRAPLCRQSRLRSAVSGRSSSLSRDRGAYQRFRTRPRCPAQGLLRRDLFYKPRPLLGLR